jgi:hypothetical protein
MFDLDRRVMKFFVGVEGMQRFLAYYDAEIDDPASLRRKHPARSSESD